MAVPTVTIKELSSVIENANTEPIVKKVCIGILNDFMDLSFGKTTPYSTGQTILPMDTTIADVDAAAANGSVDPQFKAIFKKISETFKSGNKTPQSLNGQNGVNWDPKLTPILVLVRPED